MQVKLRGYEKAFLRKFFLIFALLFALLFFVDLPPLNSAIAYIEAALLRSSGVPVSLDGTVLQYSGFAAKIVNECSGLVMVALLASLLYATDIPEHRRRRALIIFTPFLLLFNLLRLFITLYVFFAVNSLFEITHVFLWFVDSAVVLSCWYYVFRGREGFDRTCTLFSDGRREKSVGYIGHFWPNLTDISVTFGAGFR